MHLPHCVAIFYNLPWFCSIKVSNKKLQHNSEKAWGNWMCKRALGDAFEREESICTIFWTTN